MASYSTPPMPSSHPHFERARDLAERLGETLGLSTAKDDAEVDVAWAFDVANVAPAGGRSLAVGVGRARPTIVLVPMREDAPLASLIVAREIPRVFADDLVAGRTVDLSVIPDVWRTHPHLEALWRLERPETRLPELVLPDALLATPAAPRTCTTQRWFAKLERSAARWRRLRELEAPAPLVEGEAQAFLRAYERLVAAGWHEADAPLPPGIADVLGELGR